MRRYRALLAHPGLLRWSIVRVLTRFPVLAAPIAFVMLSKTQLGTYGPGAWMSAADVLVECVAAPLLGRRLDRHPMRRDIQVALAVNAISLLVIAAGVRELPTPALAALAALAGGSTAGLIGGLRTQLTAMLAEQEVHTALSWESMLTDIVFTIGPALVTGLALGVDGRLPLVLMSAGAVIAALLVPGLPGINQSTAPPAVTSPQQTGTLLSAWPIYLTSGAIMLISAEIEIAMAPLLEQSGQAIGWTGPLLSIFSIASVIGGLCYGLRGWPGAYRTQSLVLLTADAILVAITALVAGNGIVIMAIPLICAGLLFAGVITAQNLALHAVLPAHLRSTGNSLMYTGSCIGYGLSAAAIALFVSHGARHLVVISCLLTLAIAWLGAWAVPAGLRRGRPRPAGEPAQPVG
jgi:MFS family permease